MTRILHLITSINPADGGPMEAARLMGERWHAQGHVQDIVTLDAPGHDFFPDYPGQVFSLGDDSRSGLARFFRYSPALEPWLRANVGQYDAVIVAGLWRYLNLAARRVLTSGKIPYFVFPHGMLDPWFRKAYPIKHWVKQATWWWSDGPLLAHADKVLFTCAQEVVSANRAFWPYRVTPAVVGCGTEPLPAQPEAQHAAFLTAMPQLAGRRFLLYLSRLHEKKGCDLLVSAFASIAAAAPGLDLVMAGPDHGGLTPVLMAQARALGIADRVHFPGSLRGAAKYGAFRAADAFALTSHQENFGIVVAEALAAGTPVLISDKVNIWREVIEDGAGLVEPDSAQGAQRLLQRWLALGAAEQQAMRARALACFARRYDMAKVADDLMGLIQTHIAR